jgi:hypothetical protein
MSVTLEATIQKRHQRNSFSTSFPSNCFSNVRLSKYQQLYNSRFKPILLLKYLSSMCYHLLNAKSRGETEPHSSSFCKLIEQCTTSYNLQICIQFETISKKTARPSTFRYLIDWGSISFLGGGKTFP